MKPAIADDKLGRDVFATASAQPGSAQVAEKHRGVQRTRRSRATETVPFAGGAAGRCSAGSTGLGASRPPGENSAVPIRPVWKIREERKVWRDLREGALHTAPQSAGELGRADVVQVHATERSRGLLPGAERASFLSGPCSIKRAADQVPCAGGFSRLLLWVTLKHRLKRRPSASGIGNLQPLSRGKRWLCCPPCRAPTSPFPQRMGARSASAGSRNHRRTEIPASPPGPPPAGTTEISFKM